MIQLREDQKDDPNAPLTVAMFTKNVKFYLWAIRSYGITELGQKRLSDSIQMLLKAAHDEGSCEKLDTFLKELMPKYYDNSGFKSILELISNAECGELTYIGLCSLAKVGLQELIMDYNFNE